MNVQTITMPMRQARAEFDKYRTAVRGGGLQDEAWKKEDLALMQGYKALTRGQRLINLVQVMRVAGIRADVPLPKFAIARADAKICYVEMLSAGSAWFSILQGYRGQTKKRGVHLPADTFPRFGWSEQNRVTKGETLIPIIPPNLRPRRRLENFHVFWEVERWTNVAPKDPMLLKFLGGELWAVLATWDLTDLERAVLGAPAR